jgi:hypothetical protein
MSVAGRFEILSPVFSGAVETSTARDTQSGETVLLHLLPAGGGASPQERFQELAPACPGKILAAGMDPATQRPFVVTDYPRDRKAFLLWVRQLSGLAAAAVPATAGPPSPSLAPPAGTAAAESPAGATRMFDSADLFGARTRGPKVSEPSPLPADAAGATRMFDSGALFEAPAVAAPEGGSTIKLPRVPDGAGDSTGPESTSSAVTRLLASQDLAGLLAVVAAQALSGGHTNGAMAEKPQQSPSKEDSR